MPRSRVPVSLKITAGTYREDRHSHQLANSGLSVLDSLVPPDGLCERGQLLWARLAMLLAGMRVLTHADADLMQLYVADWLLLEKYNAALVDGETYVFRGAPAVKPEAKRRDACLRRIEKHQKQLGLSPASRTSLNIQPGSAGGNMMGGLEMFKLDKGGDQPLELTESQREKLVATRFFGSPEDKERAAALLARDPVYMARTQPKEQLKKGLPSRDRSAPNGVGDPYRNLRPSSPTAEEIQYAAESDSIDALELLKTFTAGDEPPAESA